MQRKHKSTCRIRVCASHTSKDECTSTRATYMDFSQASHSLNEGKEYTSRCRGTERIKKKISTSHSTQIQETCSSSYTASRRQASSTRSINLLAARIKRHPLYFPMVHPLCSLSVSYVMSIRDHVLTVLAAAKILQTGDKKSQSTPSTHPGSTS